MSFQEPRMDGSRVRDPDEDLGPGDGSTAAAVVTLAERLGIDVVFCMMGGNCGKLYDAFVRSGIRVVHAQSEACAGYMACEAALASRKPVACLVSTGAGLHNVIGAMIAARLEGAKVLLLSATTQVDGMDRFLVQETSGRTMPDDYVRGSRVFDFAAREEDPDFVPRLPALVQGMARPSGFVAHIGISSARQAAPARAYRLPAAAPATETVWDGPVHEAAHALSLRRLLFVVGFGARWDGSLVRDILDATGAPAVNTARAAGVISGKRYPTIGLGSNDDVAEYLRSGAEPTHALVLGTRLSRISAGRLLPLLPRNVIWVDANQDVFEDRKIGREFVRVHGTVDAFLRRLLACVVPAGDADRSRTWTRALGEVEPGPDVHPVEVMRAVQSQVVDRGRAWILAEAGNAFAWANRCLRFEQPLYRASLLDGALGHMACGVVGTALSERRPALVLVGDGAMHLGNGVNTAVKYGAPAVFLILNDASYGSCIDGQAARGLSCAELTVPRTDFAAYARALGARGACVTTATELPDAIDAALDAYGPAVIDVRLRRVPSPLGEHFTTFPRST